MVGVLNQDQASIYQSKLQRIVLGWDYFQLYSEAQLNPEKKRKRLKGEKEPQVDHEGLRKVPSIFKSMDDYIRTFEPLLLEECKAQILRGRDDKGAMGEPQIGVVKKCERSNEFHFAVVFAQQEVVMNSNENDLMLITVEKPLSGDALPSTYTMAIVEGRESKSTLRFRFCFDVDDSSLPIRRSAVQKARVVRMLSSLTAAADVPCWMLNLSNLSTITREYAALHSAPFLPFAETLISGKLPFSEGEASSQWDVPPALLATLRANHNEFQMKAIEFGRSRQPIVLIQGPPGTGKTQTILGLLSTVLHAIPLQQKATADGNFVLQEREEMSDSQKVEHWRKASPWLTFAGNPRDLMTQMDGGDDGEDFFGDSHHVEVLGTSKQNRPHVLVCAPSNAALDEIVLRLLHSGLRDEKGFMYSPSVVRVGLNSHHSVASVAMDTLVTQKLNSMERSAASSGARSNSAGVERDRIRLSILEDSEIVCSTLAFSGSGVFSRMSRGFDTVVIDEAAQAVEPSTLVPLCHGAQRVFLVGDPLQLPATVLSTKAVDYGYGESLFKRLQSGGFPVNMLRTQYRMHSLIREFPSREFYDGELNDAPLVDETTKRPWHKDRIFGPFFFFDLVHGKEEQPSAVGSIVNRLEADFVVLLYRQLVGLYPILKQSSKVGIISPYKLQVKLLKQQLREVEGVEITDKVDVNTIDGFQGREKDIAIFSCVRAKKKGGIGFVSDYRRMNVGLTRARASMLVVGNAVALMQDKHWRNLIKHAKNTKRYLQVPGKAQWNSIFKADFLAAMRLKHEEEQKQMGKSAEELEEEEEDHGDGVEGDAMLSIHEMGANIGNEDKDLDLEEDGGMEEEGGGSEDEMQDYFYGGEAKNVGDLDDDPEPNFD